MQPQTLAEPPIRAALTADELAHHRNPGWVLARGRFDRADAKATLAGSCKPLLQRPCVATGSAATFTTQAQKE